MNSSESEDYLIQHIITKLYAESKAHVLTPGSIAMPSGEKLGHIWVPHNQTAIIPLHADSVLCIARLREYLATFEGKGKVVLGVVDGAGDVIYEVLRVP